jgi:hypothetical protein
MLQVRSSVRYMAVVDSIAVVQLVSSLAVAVLHLVPTAIQIYQTMLLHTL